MDLIVEDPGATANTITQLVEEAGGYVSASDLNTYSDGVLSGSLTVRVPAEALEGVMSELEGLAVTVRNRSLDRADVTDQYSDVDAQLRNLQATETELRAMLEEVRERPGSTTEDIMSVYRTLTEIRGQIEQLQGRKNMLDNQIALSTLTIWLQPDSANLPVAEEEWRPAASAREAQRALVVALRGLADLSIWFVILLLPILILIVLALTVVFWILRAIFRRISKPKIAPTPAPTPTAGA
jgi:chromosome segregation ATPase